MPLIVFILPTRPVADKQYSSEALVTHTWLCVWCVYGLISFLPLCDSYRRGLPCPVCLHPSMVPQEAWCFSCLQIDSVSGRSRATACDRLMDEETLMRHCVIPALCTHSPLALAYQRRGWRSAFGHACRSSLKLHLFHQTVQRGAWYVNDGRLSAHLIVNSPMAGAYLLQMTIFRSREEQMKMGNKLRWHDTRAPE